MNIKFDLLDIVISVIIIAIYFIMHYILKGKFYKKLKNPVQVIKHDIKLSRYFFIFIVVFIIIYFTIDFYYYFENVKLLNLPYTIKIFPFTFFFLHFFIINSLKNTLKELEENTEDNQ
ncbi:MAG: hypothetical protein H6Q16_1469 [Bacteroidetes bacterium]|nr:hypothetical protein [Bacteroidota bacterium]